MLPDCLVYLKGVKWQDSFNDGVLEIYDLLGQITARSHSVAGCDVGPISIVFFFLKKKLSVPFITKLCLLLRIAVRLKSLAHNNFY